MRWKKLGLDPWAVNIIKEGYSISFWSQPPFATYPSVHSSTSNPECNSLLQADFQTLLDKGAIEIPEDKSSPGFYSRLFLVPKPNQQWRPVIDLSLFNNYIRIPRFKMDTPKNIRASLRKGRWVFSLDLKDAYFQIPIHPTSRNYQWLEFRNTVFQFKALPFRIGSSPRWWGGQGTLQQGQIVPVPILG